MSIGYDNANTYCKDRSNNQAFLASIESNEENAGVAAVVGEQASQMGFDSRPPLD